MYFSQLPQQYAPLGQEIRYTVEQDTPGNIDVRILENATDTLLGAKRFAETTSAGFDAAPILRRALQFVPSTGGTGFKSVDGRTVTARVEALPTGSETVAVSAVARTFLPGVQNPDGPGIRTSMPLERLIPAGACDELTFYSERTCSVTVYGHAGDTTTAESFASAGAGLHVFRIDTRDFPECETITVDAGVCGSVSYTVVPAVQNAVRLAWKSRAGSIEHYSFPLVRTTRILADKQRAVGIEGHLVATAATSRETTLVSAYESQQMLEVLAEITAAPEVWFAEADRYSPADVVTDEAVVQQIGTLCSLEIVVRPKNDEPWN